MTFLRVEQKKSGNYLRIVESVREGKKVIQKTKYTLGKLEDYKPESLIGIADKLRAIAGADSSLAGAKSLQDTLSEEGRYNYGFGLFVDYGLKSYKLDELIDRIKRRKKIGLDIYATLKLMLMDRFNEPCSKHRSYQLQRDYIGLPAIELHHIYRSLDFLADHEDDIQTLIYNQGRSLFNNPLDVVFYDVTTLYFDSTTETDGALRQKGFSKDGKMGNTQIVMGLLIDKFKQPIGYQIYSGDVWEGNTFVDAVEKLKSRYNIKQVTVVADRGMLSGKNLETLGERKYEYIIGERLKTLPSDIKNKLIDINNYRQEWVISEGKSLPIKYFTVEYKGRTIIGTWSEKRRAKDALDREKRIAQGNKMLDNTGLITKKANQFYLKGEQTQGWKLDEEKIALHAKYDGFLAIATNSKALTALQVLDNYRHLFQIEHSFRTFKSTLETRPMFHWTDKRIRGHMCMCYLAYAILSASVERLKLAKTPMTEQEISRTLDSMQVSLLRNGDEKHYLRSKETENQVMLLKMMKKTKLPNLINHDALANYL